MATDGRLQVDEASRDRVYGESVCFRCSRYSIVAVVRLGTSGREGSGYSPLAAVAGTTILPVGSWGRKPRSLSRWTRVLGHDSSALLHGAVFGVSQRGAECSVVPETVVSISISIDGIEIEMGRACVGRVEGSLTLLYGHNEVHRLCIYLASPILVIFGILPSVSHCCDIVVCFEARPVVYSSQTVLTLEQML